MHDPTLPVDPDGHGLRFSPTDLSRFIRLEQCRRFLRLRLHERTCGSGFMAENGVRPQAIPPLLTRTGRAFEAEVEAAVRQRYPAVSLAEEAGGSAEREPDNARVLEAIRTLPPGGVNVLFQARLHVALDDWELTGDVDLLRLERDPAGCLDLLIADMKSTAATQVEHRLQVAFYDLMLGRLLDQEAVPNAGIRTGILYRGAGAAESEGASEREASQALFGVEALLEIIPDPHAYREAVRDLVTGPDSLARQVAAAPFDTLPFHLTAKCDSCLYSEFCMKWCAERDDLSLLPHLTAAEKSALQRAGIATAAELALLKEFPPSGDGAETGMDLLPAPGKEALCRRVATTWPVGPRLDELVHRARRYRKWKRDPIRALRFIPSKGYGSLPYCDATQNPNLVRVYIDAQHDYLHDRLYLLGALVVACEAGLPTRRRSIVHLAPRPWSMVEGQWLMPEASVVPPQPSHADPERALLLRWIEETLLAVVELAAPDPDTRAAGGGEKRAPIHLVFWNGAEQKRLLEALARHSASVLGAAPALYEFMTQLAAYDSPIATFLDAEIRELKNYSMLCQSLQAVAAYLKFDWNVPERFTERFRERMFDYWGKLDAADAEPAWYAARSRFSSQIPLEYAYAAWDELPRPTPGERDDFAAYRKVTPDLLRRFQARRLEALEWIATDFGGNALTQKTPFTLPDLASFSDRARSLAQALDEFVTIERHAELHAWKMARHAPPERRVLMGETLLVRYREADQDPAAAERNRENERRRLLQEQYRAAFREAHPDAARVQLPREQKAESDWSQEGLRLRLRLETEGLDCTLDGRSRSAR
jgi:hypothetical protein